MVLNKLPGANDISFFESSVLAVLHGPGGRSVIQRPEHADALEDCLARQLLDGCGRRCGVVQAAERLRVSTVWLGDCEETEDRCTPRSREGITEGRDVVPREVLS